MILRHSTAYHVRFNGLVLNRFRLSAVLFIIGAFLFHYGYSVADDHIVSTVFGVVGFILLAIAGFVIKPWLKK